jgi:SAM-dependent methyltransferase
MPRVCVACRGQRLENISEELRYDDELAGVTSAWRYRWLRCSSCELRMLDPEPSLALVQRFIERNLSRSQRSLRSRLGSAFSLLSWSLALQLPKDAVILDLAPSDGRWLTALRARGYRRLNAHVVAARPERITALRQRGVVVTEGSFLSQELPSASYDCIRVHDGFAMLSEPAATVRQCLRMLKPSGVLIVHVPAWACAQASDGPCHVYHHSAEAMRSLLSAAGFRDLQALAPRQRAPLGVVFDRMRQQAGKSAVPGLVRWILGPVYMLATLWGDQRHWLTFIAREPAAVRLRPSTNGHPRGFRSAFFTRYG